jgi:hypothetical protein
MAESFQHRPLQWRLSDIFRVFFVRRFCGGLAEVPRLSDATSRSTCPERVPIPFIGTSRALRRAQGSILSELRELTLLESKDRGPAGATFEKLFEFAL